MGLNDDDATASTGDTSPLQPDPSAVDRDPSSGDPDESLAAAEGPGDGSVNNPAADPANESGDGRPSSGVLDQLYDTLGAVTAGQQLREQDGEELKQRLLEREKALIDVRKAALDAEDEKAFEAATSELEQLMQAWQVLDASDDDEEAADAGTDQHAGRPGDPGDGEPGDGDTAPPAG